MVHLLPYALTVHVFYYCLPFICHCTYLVQFTPRFFALRRARVMLRAAHTCLRTAVGFYALHAFYCRCAHLRCYRRAATPPPPLRAPACCTCTAIPATGRYAAHTCTHAHAVLLRTAHRAPTCVTTTVARVLRLHLSVRFTAFWIAGWFLYAPSVRDAFTLHATAPVLLHTVGLQIYLFYPCTWMHTDRQFYRFLPPYLPFLTFIILYTAFTHTARTDRHAFCVFCCSFPPTRAYTTCARHPCTTVLLLPPPCRCCSFWFHTTYTFTTTTTVFYLLWISTATLTFLFRLPAACRQRAHTCVTHALTATVFLLHLLAVFCLPHLPRTCMRLHRYVRIHCLLYHHASPAFLPAYYYTTPVTRRLHILRGWFVLPVLAGFLHLCVLCLRTAFLVACTATRFLHQCHLPALPPARVYRLHLHCLFTPPATCYFYSFLHAVVLAYSWFPLRSPFYHHHLQVYAVLLPALLLPHTFLPLLVLGFFTATLHLPAYLYYATTVPVPSSHLPRLHTPPALFFCPTTCTTCLHCTSPFCTHIYTHLPATPHFSVVEFWWDIPPVATPAHCYVRSCTFSPHLPTAAFSLHMHTYFTPLPAGSYYTHSAAATDGQTAAPPPHAFWTLDCCTTIHHTTCCYAIHGTGLHAHLAAHARFCCWSDIALLLPAAAAAPLPFTHARTCRHTAF